MKTITLLFSLWAALATTAGTAAADGRPLRRFALLAGANNGGPDRVTLRYALTDAQALADVLGQLGGVAPQDRLLVSEPDPAALEAAFTEMGRRLEAARAAGDRVELLFYYSGHSDEAGLLLGGQRVGYASLRQRVDALPADVRIAIVDACASGALTRPKGGQRRPPFLLDAATRVRGYAILTSASADESAQESDRIGGSFFTHALLSGLRGAADMTGDGRVTLNEAYQFAYHETLARTEQTRLGAQHPSYDLNLSGQGDVVLTDVRSTGAGLVLDKGLSGRLYVRDAEGHLVAELNKPAGRAMELGFEAGRYRVTLDQAGALARADLDLADGAHRPLAAADFTPIEGELAVARGGVATATQAEVVPANLGIVPGLDTNAGRPVINHVSVSLLVGSGYALDGFEVGGVGVTREAGVDGVQVGGVFAIDQGDLDGAQIGGAFTLTRGAVDGVQVGGAFNLASGAVDGAQIGGAFNYAGDALDGLQVGGAFNYVGGRLDGLQVAGAVNTARGPLTGAQLSGLANTAGDVEGAQISVVNVGGHVTGLQLGIINIAETMRGAPIGLINIIGDGIHELEVGGTDITPARLSLRLGSQWFYSTWTAGARPTDDMYLIGLGLGGRVPLTPAWSVDLRATAHQILDAKNGYFENDSIDTLGRAELAVTWQVIEGLKLTAGPAYNVLVSDVRDGHDLAFGLDQLHRDGDLNVRRWPGAFVGVTVF
ncbi:MAG: caspase family protein [Myxococcales bacterium]|nr:caspase family protein [Myxococcales bacterium]